MSLQDRSDEQRLIAEDFDSALAQVAAAFGPEAVDRLLAQLGAKAGIESTTAAGTPYRNSIAAAAQPDYPGHLALEGRLEELLRWNALAMVVSANHNGSGLGGHVATYASCATLLEVALNHFIRASAPAQPDFAGDLVFYQAHASPGLYARALLEGRLSLGQAAAFRQQLSASRGLPSYPHPRHMPDFWPAPTASMGLSTPLAIGQARFLRYLERRGLKRACGERVWIFAGDGEMDEPEVLGSAALAAREHLDNLILVVNCNLQRLDGPVRGNGKIIQELERSFLGLGWRVIKVVWGSGWDDLLARDVDGSLQRRMDTLPDGRYQWYSTRSGAEQRAHWCGEDPRLRELMGTLSDEELANIPRGGHDPRKIHAAFDAATRADGRPTVILAKTIKGYGLGGEGQATNTTHQKKSFSPATLVQLARRWNIPLADEAAAQAALYVPPADDPAIRHLLARRSALGGPAPSRRASPLRLPTVAAAAFAERDGGSDRPQSTTMVFSRLLSRLLRDPQLGARIVPIVADEARTFGLEGLFKQVGIHSPVPQGYEPVDAASLASYVERTDGQLLQEGISEATALCSFVAAGTSYSTWSVPMLPIYIFYSIFGLQRVGDLIWAAGDQLTRGILVGATAGRTTLHGEGLQHQDGHTPLWASAVPNLVTYDPAYGYELAAIVEHALASLAGGADAMYYITVYNENYPMPARPEHANAAEIVSGMYELAPGEGGSAGDDGPSVQLLASGPIVPEALRARGRLQELGVRASVWSVTSWNELYRDAVAAEARDSAARQAPAPSRIARALAGRTGVVVACSDYVSGYVDRLARFVAQPFSALGTDGWGLSASRAELRAHFGVDAHSICVRAVSVLARHGQLDAPGAERILGALGNRSAAHVS